MNKFTSTDVSRVVVVAMAVAAMAGSAPSGPAVADPSATQVINAVAVGPNGQPINGYQEAPSQGDVTTVTDCTTPSPSAVANDIYYCAPSAADAGTCWPSTPGSLLCVDNSSDNRVHRVTYGGQLPQVQPTAIPEPFAMVLDDGTRCRIRNGAAWDGRDDGYVGTYGCGAANSNLGILWLPSQGPGSCINRSAPAWMVKVGQLGSPGEHFPPPQTHTVTTAWFASDFVPA